MPSIFIKSFNQYTAVCFLTNNSVIKADLIESNDAALFDLIKCSKKFVYLIMF